MKNHIPVMLNECIKSLDIKSNGTYVDLTLGRGGHSSAILKKLDKGMLYSFDKDRSAILNSKSDLLKISTNFKLIHSDFKYLKEELGKFKVNSVDGILVDLGVSSPQLDQAERGFSYNKDYRLDMRMDQTQELDAYVIVNQWSESELINIFKYNADVKLPQRVAQGIIKNRPIETTLELVTIIRSSLPSAIVRKKNPAKAVFQSIRIAVNNELDSLESMLEQAINLLNKNGKLAIITFHSIEDRIVKRFFKQFIEDNTGKLPIIIDRKWTVKTYKPRKAEIDTNYRSRSAKLRVLTKKG